MRARVSSETQPERMPTEARILLVDKARSGGSSGNMCWFELRKSFVDFLVLFWVIKQSLYVIFFLDVQSTGCPIYRITCRLPDQLQISESLADLLQDPAYLLRIALCHES
jgi:hypothetical protein